MAARGALCAVPRGTHPCGARAETWGSVCDSCGAHTHTHTGRTYAFTVPAVIPADRLIRLQLPVHPTPITSVKLHHSKLDDEGNEPEEVRARANARTYIRPG